MRSSKENIMHTSGITTAPHLEYPMIFFKLRDHSQSNALILLTHVVKKKQVAGKYSIGESYSYPPESECHQHQ